MLGPMNGRGYFGIDKTTLTSMLSVRYISIYLYRYLDNVQIMNFLHCSLTYIIILVQFQLSESGGGGGDSNSTVDSFQNVDLVQNLTSVDIDS